MLSKMDDGYSKWDHLDLSDDSDVEDCHPNIDEKLWRRIQKEKKEKEWAEEDVKKAGMVKEQEAALVKQKELQAVLTSEDASKVAAAAGELESLTEQMTMRGKEVDKLETLFKWRSTNAAVVGDGDTDNAEHQKLEFLAKVEKLPVEERISHATYRKEAGTTLFKEKKWQDAADKYQEGWDFLRTIASPEEMALCRDISLSLLLNNAAVQLKLEQFGQAASFCNKVLALDTGNVKGLFRRGVALTGTRDFAKAKKDLAAAAKLAPKDKSIRRAFAEAKRALNAANAKAAHVVTEEEEAEQFQSFLQTNEEIFSHFAGLKTNKESEEFLLNHSKPPAEAPLLTSEATGWLLLKCLELEMNGKTREMKKVARQNEMIEYITRMTSRDARDGTSKPIRDPREGIKPFFHALNSGRLEKGFEEDLAGVIKHVQQRAKVKLQEREEEGEDADADEEVVDLESLPLEERLGPGGLDPVEVMKSLPKGMQDCFTARDIPGLQELLKEMPEDEARVHMQRCTDAGLWNPQ